jgi:hypothetical protein
MLADNAHQPIQFVELQRSLHHDEQDIELEMDTYCVVTSSGIAHYGGIISCIMTTDDVCIDFSDEAQSTLGIDGYRLFLRLSDSEKEILASGLHKLFDSDKHPPQHLMLKWSEKPD